MITNLTILIVLISILVPLIYFLFLARKAMKKVKSIKGYLPLNPYLKLNEYTSSSVVATLSVATVIVAIFNYAPVLGISLLWAPFTFAIGYILFWFFIPLIKSTNNQGLTLHGFLGHYYNSKLVTQIAAFATLIAYLLIFALELRIGVMLLETFFTADYTFLLASLFLIFILIYVVSGGFQTVVETDKVQMVLIVVTVSTLILIGIITGIEDGVNVLINFDSSLINTHIAPLSLVIGLALINIPGGLTDMGQWQRVMAAENSETARKGIFYMAGFSLILWSIIIIIAISFSGHPEIQQIISQRNGGLIDAIFIFTTNFNPILYAIILFFLISGLIAAMISTADSFLIAAVHAGVIDIKSNLSGAEKYIDKKDDNKLLSDSRKASIVLAWIGLFAMFGIEFIGIELLPLILGIYGGLLVLFPPLIAILIFKRSIAPSFIVIIGIIAGFIGCWGAVIIGTIYENTELTDFGPLLGMLISGGILLIGALINNYRGK